MQVVGILTRVFYVWAVGLSIANFSRLSTGELQRMTRSRVDQMVELKNAMKNLRDLVFCTLAEYQDKAKIQLPEIADSFQDYLLQALRFLASNAPPGVAQIMVLDFDDVAMLAQRG